jgi:hypothetical protein
MLRDGDTRMYLDKRGAPSRKRLVETHRTA